MHLKESLPLFLQQFKGR